MGTALLEGTQGNESNCYYLGDSMNERIKELLKQSCGFEYDEDGNELTPILVGKDLAKFAELIVKECAEFVQFYYKDHMCEVIAHDMKQHFGVEE
jgi:hypothetical protein